MRKENINRCLGSKFKVQSLELQRLTAVSIMSYSGHGALSDDMNCWKREG